MGDCKSVASGLEGEENLIAAAQHIVKALGSNKNLTDDVRKILVDLGSQLSTISIADESKGLEINEIEDRLNAAQDKVMSWEADQCMIWDSGPEETAEYLKAVEEIRKLTEVSESLRLKKVGEGDELLRRAYDVLQTAMARLEEEFRHLLFQHRQPFEPEHMSFRSIEEDAVDEGSIISVEDDPVEDPLQCDSISRSSEDYTIPLVNPDVIPDIKSIANLMLSSNYDQECSQAYITIRKDALDECLSVLEMEKLSIEDVLRMEWAGLNSKIRRWIRTMKIFVRVYLPSEKWLADQIFGEAGSIGSICFVEASRTSIFQLLNFGEAVVIGSHKPEKLMRILDMYEVLAGLLPDIDGLYQEEIGSSVRTECHEVLGGLGDCVRATFHDFENAIASNISTSPFPGGGIHHLARYVMNYIQILTDYNETINLLFVEHDRADPGSSSSNGSPVTEEENRSGCSSCITPIGLRFRALISILECNLEEKSKLYRDVALQHLFLMNNIHYMTEKVKNSELRAVFGDEWIRKHNWKFQQHAMNYERASWSSILLLLKDENTQNSSSSSTSKTVLKDRLRSFNIAFEELYKSQTAWLVPDSQLRDELQISTSLKVVQAYRTFVGRPNTNLSDKHIKYSPDDLQNFLLDLFVGSPKSLPNSHRR